MFLGMTNTPNTTSDTVLNGAGVMVGLSIGPLMLKLATRNEFLIAAMLLPISGI